uniref:Carboxyvinyl-carboxyphosphonate phosphorylmutase n=1 Tax=Ditylum brightwellii TaxID=49249 RepID=A0A7S4W9X9_9STRA
MRTHDNDTSTLHHPQNSTERPNLHYTLHRYNHYSTTKSLTIHICYISSIYLIVASFLTTTTTALSSSSSPASRLRNLCLTSRKTSSAIALPGVHDALSAIIFAESGANALFLSGFGVTASRLGSPDAGLLTQTEMEDATKCVVSALSLSSSSQSPPPLLMVDGDTGYGGAANIRRTIRGLACAGAAAVTIEDQTFPKRCTYAAGTGVSTVPRSESMSRINAAIAAREEAKNIDGNDILLVARTDCRLERGLEEVIERCKTYEALGADIVYAENLQSRQEYEALRSSLKGETLTMLAQLQLYPNDEDEKRRIQGAPYTIDDVGDMGYDLALFGVTGLQSAVGALQGVAREFFANKGIVTSRDDNTEIVRTMASFEEVKRVVGFPKLDEFESRYYHD